MKNNSKIKFKKLLGPVVIFVILLIISLIFVTPFIWTLLTSFKSNEEIYSAQLKILPSFITFGHYIKVLTQMESFIQYTMNSVEVSFWSIGLTIIFSTTMGYAFSKINFRGKNILFIFIMLVLTLPYVIYLIPIYMFESRMDLIDTTWGLILPYIATNLPMSVIIMRGQYNSIPKAIEEAATIDGCTQWDSFVHIMLPLVKPAIATVIIYTFINVWGEFTFARTLTSTAKSQTLPVGITFLRDEAASWQYGTLCAVIMLSMIPLLVIFLSMQKYLIKGIMEGAIKG